MTNLVEDSIVTGILIRQLGLRWAESYARRISQVPGGNYSAQYARVADELRLRINKQAIIKLNSCRSIDDEEMQSEEDDLLIGDRQQLCPNCWEPQQFGELCSSCERSL